MNKKGANKWIAFNFDPIVNSKESPKSSNKTVKSVDLTEDEDIKINNFSFSNKNKINFNLLEKLKPKSVDDLAVHPKKIKEVELWLQQNVVSPSNKAKTSTPILLLTGPTGSGKTSTISVLCKSMNIKIREWINPVDHDFEFGFGQAQLSRFLDFFTQSKYTSLCEDINSKKISLVEDFPNFVTYNPSQFNEILEKCYAGHSPVVFVCSDANNSKLDLSQALFPQDVKERFQITNISFNPCSATLLKNLMKNAGSVTKAHPDLFRTLSLDVVEAIICSTMGDIRCAINQYHFASLKGAKEMPTVTDLNQSRGKKRKRNINPTSSIKSMLKDETLGFFHGLGRVLNPKRIEIDGSWKIQCDFDSLIDQFSTQPSTFNAFLHENYLKYFGDFGEAQKAALILSDAQVFLQNWTDRQELLLYTLWIAVLGLMAYNKHKVSKWNQIKGPNKTKSVNSKTVETRYINATDQSYYNIITNSDKFHIFK